MRTVLVIAAVGCGSAPTQSAVPVARTPQPIEQIPYVLPDASPPPKWHLACEGTARTRPKRLVYEFSPTRLYPIASGPRIANRSPAGKPRSWLQLEEALEHAEPTMRHCWYWASARGAAETTLDIAFTMTPLGKTIAHSVIDPSGGSRELVMCLQENLQHMRIDDLSARTTRMRTRIAFTRVEQLPWPKRPQRPKPIAPEPRAKTCMPVLDDAPVDQLASPITYTITDFSEDRIPVDPKVPTVRIGCAQPQKIFVNKATVRNAADSNRGAFQACYAEARSRDPSLAGNVSLALTFADGTTTAAVSGPGDAAFHACMRSAGEAVSIVEASADRMIEATFHFELQEPDDAIDYELLLGADVDDVNKAKTDHARCEAMASVVNDLAELAPWLDDARLLAATKDFARFVASTNDKACLLGAQETLREIAFGYVLTSPTHPMHLHWSWLDRIEAVLPVAPHVEWGKALRWFHGATLAMSARHADGIAALRALAGERNERDNVWSRVADDELDRYELPKRVPSSGCEPIR